MPTSPGSRHFRYDTALKGRKFVHCTSKYSSQIFRPFALSRLENLSYQRAWSFVLSYYEKRPSLDSCPGRVFFLARLVTHSNLDVTNSDIDCSQIFLPFALSRLENLSYYPYNSLWVPICKKEITFFVCSN